MTSVCLNKYKALSYENGIDPYQKEFTFGKIKNHNLKFFKKLKSISDWKGTASELRDRIQKMILNDKFNQKELKVLNNMIKMECCGVISINDIEDAFPGKSRDQIVMHKQKYAESH